MYSASTLAHLGLGPKYSVPGNLEPTLFRCADLLVGMSRRFWCKNNSFAKNYVNCSRTFAHEALQGGICLTNKLVTLQNQKCAV